jgi:hypothetical protein
MCINLFIYEMYIIVTRRAIIYELWGSTTEMKGNGFIAVAFDAVMILSIH